MATWGVLGNMSAVVGPRTPGAKRRPLPPSAAPRTRAPPGCAWPEKRRGSRSALFDVRAPRRAGCSGVRSGACHGFRGCPCGLATVVAQREAGRLEIVSRSGSGRPVRRAVRPGRQRCGSGSRPDARVDDLRERVGQAGELGVVPTRCCGALKRAPGRCQRTAGSVVTIAAEAQVWPDGWSGNGGVTSGGARGRRGRGSNSGKPSVSAAVAGCRRCPPRGWR